MVRTCVGTVALVLVGLAGCSGSQAITPQSTPERSDQPLALAPHGNEGFLGSARVELDLEAGTATVDPVRMNQAIGDAFLVGLNDIDHLCDCFRVQGVSTEPIPGGLRVSLRATFDHPFPAAARPDLNGWDLKAIVASDLNQQPFGAGGSASAGVLVNADGYTGEWSDQIALAQPGLTSTLYPYILLGEDPTVSDPFDFQNPSGWNVFPAGGSNAGTFVFDLPFASSVALDLFFTVGYQASATRATRQTPDYQPPRGNSRSAWKVEGTLSNNNLSTSIGTTADLDLAIWDWHHGQTLGSDVVSAQVHVPELAGSPIPVTLGTGSGRDTDPLTGTATLINALGTTLGGTIFALIEVVDELDGANPGGFGGEAGMTKIADDFATVLPYDDIRTFQVLAVQVDANLPGVDPVAVITSLPPLQAGTLTVNRGSAPCLSGATSFDPDAPASPEGDLVLYEWDFEWNGVPGSFTDDTAGANLMEVKHHYPTATSTNVGLRVTDGVGRTGTVAVPLTVTNLNFALTLDPPIDLNTVTNNRVELGAALVEEPNGAMGIGFAHIEIVSAIQLNSRYGYFRNPSGTWNTAVDFYTNSIGHGGNAFAYGLHLKAYPSTGTNSAHVVGRTEYLASPPAGTGSVVAAFTPPGAANRGFPCLSDYGVETVSNVLNGNLLVFHERPTTTPASPQLWCSRGGPNNYLLPSIIWYSPPVVTPVNIDNRPNQISLNRSAAAGPTGEAFLAYRAQDRSRLSLASDLNGDNAGWSTLDIATATPAGFGDPSLDLDGLGGMHIALAHFTGGTWRYEWYESCDLGLTWQPAVIAGATFATEPLDTALSVRWIQNAQVIGISYVAGNQQRLRWSADSGATWTDSALSPGVNEFSADFLFRRNGSELFAAWSNFAGTRENINVRRGVISGS